MCNMFELSGLFICLEGLVKFFSTFWDRKYCWVVVFKVGGLVPSLKLCIFFLVNVSYIVCKSTLFEMTFEIHFHQKTLHTFKNMLKYLYCSSRTFVNRQLLSSITNMINIFPSWSSDEAFRKKLCCGHIYCQFSCFIF